MKKAKEKQIQLVRSCPHCGARHKLSVQVETGIGRGPKTREITCVECDKRFTVTIPERIVSGPFQD